MYEVQVVTGMGDMTEEAAGGPVFIDLIGAGVTSGEHRLEPVNAHVRPLQPGTISCCQVLPEAAS